MDIIGGLAAANQAISLVKEIREIDRSVNEAEFKSKIADLSLALADARIALSEAKLAVQEKEVAITDLNKLLDEAKNGEHCPKCKNGNLKLSRTEPHHMYGASNFGVEQWYLECSDRACGFEQTRIHDPHGVLKELARKR